MMQGKVGRIPREKVNPLTKIFLYLASVCAVGIVVSPVAYWICQWLIGEGWLQMLSGFPFHRYFTRTLQVAALTLLVPLVFWLRIRRIEDFGIQRNEQWDKELCIGFSAAFACLSLLGCGYVFSGVYGLRDSWEWSKVFQILATAAVVAPLEEIVFRGVILGLVSRAFGTVSGGIFSAALFALLHFVKPSKTDLGDPVTWASGWEQFVLLFSGLPPFPVSAYAAATLFFVGLFLAWTVVQTRSLWLAIGLHAGWIIAQQGLNGVAKYRAVPKDALLPWIGESVVSGAVPTGLLPLGALLFLWGGIFLWLRKR